APGRRRIAGAPRRPPPAGRRRQLAARPSGTVRARPAGLRGAARGGGRHLVPARRDAGGGAVTASRVPESATDVDLAAEVYVAGYPLVVTVRTLQHLGQLTGVNRLTWQRRLPGPGARAVVAPNRDTLYGV